MFGLFACLVVSAAAGDATSTADAATDWGTDVRLGGVGGVYFLATPGELWVEIEKRDLNNSDRRTHLRVILVGPDRSIIEELAIPDDGREKGSGAGPVQRVRLSTTVSSPGIYGLNVTVTDDRYGEDLAWGFRTNCSRYVIETSRGHRDAAHEEPLVLLNADSPGDVCFLPRGGEFAVEATELPASSGALTMYDADGRQVAVLPVSESGEVAHVFPAEVQRAAIPWRLHFPKFEGVVHIDGLTRWTEDEAFVNLSLWTPRLDAWFPLQETRWLLTPYSRNVYGASGEEESVSFQVHNNGLVEETVALHLEFQDHVTWPVALSVREVALEPGATAPVSVAYRVPSEGDGWVCRVRATPMGKPELSTYSTLLLTRGVAPADRPLAMPLVLKAYRHENEQFGYLPAYPLTNQVYFDRKNRPVVTSDAGISTWRDGQWTESTVARPVDGQAAPFGLRTSKVAFDDDNDRYCIAAQGEHYVLLHSRDEGRSLTSLPIPGTGAFDIEQFSGHNRPSGPPPFVRFTLTAKDPNVFWRRLNDLALFLPEKTADGTVSMSEPILLSRKSIGLSTHSGIPSSIVSRDGKVHVAWAEATEPEEEVPGVPTFVATYDRRKGRLSKPALVGYGPPANDIHNTPSITMDSRGYLHVLIGTHGRTFRYARSKKPNDASGGWTEAEDIGPGLRQTYVGLVCDQDDVLHVVFRLWRTDTTYFPAGHYACLAYMRKPPDEAWSAPQPLVVAPFSEYSIFYHRLTINRTGQLFLSYDYWSTFWFYRNDHWGKRRALLTSPDQGLTWKLAAQRDLSR